MSYGYHEYRNRIRGKSAGSFVVKTFDHANAPSVSVTVSDTTVSVTSMKLKVITDIDWDSEPSNTYTYDDVFQASVTVSSIFTQRPAGSTRGHYGYLFAEVVYSDGTVEDVMASDLDVINSSPNAILTAPGDIDEHSGVSDLYMYV